jgi:branched-chain amino acid transport system permease protein
VLALAALIVLPQLGWRYELGLLSEVFVFAIFAMSLDLLLGFTGLMSFGHAAFFGIGAYTAVLLGASFGLSGWIGLAAAVLAAGAGALLIGFFCVRTSGISFLMLTLAFAQLVYSIAFRWRDLTGGSDGVALADRPAFFGWDLSDPLPMYYMTLLAFVLCYLALQRLIASPLGSTFAGIRENEARMRAIGYRTGAYKLLAFGIGGALAGLAGGLYAIFNGFVSPDALHWSASGDVLIMVMLGGAGSLIGPAIGAAAFLLMKNLASSYNEHWMMIVGAIFIGCVLFFPGGLWGTLRKRWPAGGAKSPAVTLNRGAEPAAAAARGEAALPQEGP